MANKIILKKSSVSEKVPTTGDLDYGELALNYADGKLYYKTSTNTIEAFVAGAGGGSSSDSFKNIAVAGQSTVVADSPTDTLTLVGGTGLSITTDSSTDTITLTNSSPDQVVSLTGSGSVSISGTYPNFTISGTDTNTTYSAGSGLNQIGTIFEHDNTSSVTTLSATSRTYVTGLTFDSFGHVTGYTTGSETVTDTNTTYSISAETTTGGADLRLTGSDTTTDNVSIIGGTNVTVTRTDANTITISANDTSVEWSEIQNKPDPTITLAGDLTGSVTLTDLANGTLTATIAANSVELGTDTTGNYVATIASGTGISVSGSGSENAAVTVSHADTSTVTNLTATARTYVTALTFDDFGHVTGYTTSSETVTDTNTTYSISAETATGGVNLRLTGSDSSTDDVKLAAGTNITLTRTDANTITIAASGGGGGSWKFKTANYTAVTGDSIIATTTSGSFTITLPATPSQGDSITIADGDNWQTNNLTVARNGSTIKGLSEDLVMDLAGAKIDFVYSGTTWLVFGFASGADDTLAVGLAVGDEF
jgi:hypothetical protein